jgi:hypothetical protein
VESRFIRLTQTGMDVLIIDAIEFFGSLREASPPAAVSRPAPVARPAPPPTPAPIPLASKSKQQKGVEFPLDLAKPLDGIISHLTRKHGGNVHDKGIVTITSKSVNDLPGFHYAVRDIARLTDGPYFWSKNEKRQWVCWDFHKMRIRPTNYVISGAKLKSWVVESSMNGWIWKEIDRQTDNRDFKSFYTVHFAVSKPAECRFIRLTQTDRSHDGNYCLIINAVEFFGNLAE